MIDGWAEGWTVTYARGLSCASGVRSIQASAVYHFHCSCLGDKADLWGLWPGTRLRHPDGGRRGGGGRPEDRLPRVSDSFDLSVFALLLPSVLYLLPAFNLPHNFHFGFSCSMLSSFAFTPHLFLFWHACLLSSSAFLQRESSLSSSHPAALFSLLCGSSFVSSPPDAAVHAQLMMHHIVNHELFSMWKTRSQPGGAANCILMPPDSVF